LYHLGAPELRKVGGPRSKSDWGGVEGATEDTKSLKARLRAKKGTKNVQRGWVPTTHLDFRFEGFLKVS